MKKINIGIDASRNRSGGAKAHIIGVLSTYDQEYFADLIDQVHVWAYRELLDTLPDSTWLVKHSPKALEQNIFKQLWWQRKSLPKEIRTNNVDILLNTDAGTVSRFNPSVTMSRDMLSYEKGEIYRYSLFSKERIRLELLKCFQNRSLTKSTAAIFLTTYAAEVIQESSGKIENHAIIPHGVSDNFRVITNKGIWDAKQDQIIKCIYVSNLDLYKHQWNVATAIHNLVMKGHNITIDFVGGGLGRARQIFDKTLQSMSDSNFITLHEFVPHSELPQLFIDKDIIVFASSCENMPNTLIEGMSSGLPIACSNRGPMPEVLKDGGVYFDPEKPEEIEFAIEKIIKDAALRKDISNKSLFYSQEYSWKRCSKETFNFLVQTYKNFRI